MTEEFELLFPTPPVLILEGGLVVPGPKGEIGPDGPQGLKGEPGLNGLDGLDGADAVAGKLPSAYVELVSPIGTVSASFEDVSGMSTTITLDEAVEISVMASFEVQTQSGASASTIELCFSIDGVEHDPVKRYLSGSNDVGIGALVHRTGELAAGTYTVKLKFRRVSGVSTPGLNRADMLVMAMQGAKGEQGPQGEPGPSQATTILNQNEGEAPIKMWTGSAAQYAAIGVGNYQADTFYIVV